MKVYSKTHVGLVREKNEDSMLVCQPNLFAIADGMGGCAGGEIASSSALNVFNKFLQRNLQDEKNVAFALRKTISETNREIYYMANDSQDYKGMGTTLTAVYLENCHLAHVVQIGDSRLYRYRDKKLLQITEDQTLVAHLLETGKISEDEAKVHPKKNLLLQAIGTERVVQPEVAKLEIAENDILLLCSDGLTNMVSDTDIEKVFQEVKSDAWAENLIELALKNGGKDNISLIILTEFGVEDKNGKNN